MIVSRSVRPCLEFICERKVAKSIVVSSIKYSLITGVKSNVYLQIVILKKQNLNRKKSEFVKNVKNMNFFYRYK